MRVVLDLTLVAGEGCLLAAQHEQLDPARRQRAPGHRAAADGRSLLDLLGGLGEAAVGQRERGLRRSDGPELGRLPQFVRKPDHRGQLGRAAVGVAELPSGPEPVLVSVEEPFLVSGSSGRGDDLLSLGEPCRRSVGRERRGGRRGERVGECQGVADPASEPQRL